MSLTLIKKHRQATLKFLGNTNINQLKQIYLTTTTSPVPKTIHLDQMAMYFKNIKLDCQYYKNLINEYNIVQITERTAGQTGKFIITKKNNENIKFFIKVFYYSNNESKNVKNDMEINIYQILNKLFWKSTLNLIRTYREVISCKKEHGILFINKDMNNIIWTLNDINLKNDYKIILLELGEITLGDYYDTKTFTIQEYQSHLIQLIYTLLIFYEYAGFIHQDLHFNNILMNLDPNFSSDQTKYYHLKYYDHDFYVPVTKYIPKIFDFDNSLIQGKPNLIMKDLKRIEKSILKTKSLAQNNITQKYQKSLEDCKTADNIHLCILNNLKFDLKPPQSQIIQTLSYQGEKN